MVTKNYQFPRITEEMHEEMEKWYNEHNNGKCANRYHGAIGGEISFFITPTSIGDFLEVQCTCGEKLCFEEL